MLYRGAHTQMLSHDIEEDEERHEYAGSSLSKDGDDTFRFVEVPEGDIEAERPSSDWTDEAVLSAGALFDVHSIDGIGATSCRMDATLVAGIVAEDNETDAVTWIDLDDSGDAAALASVFKHAELKSDKSCGPHAVAWRALRGRSPSGSPSVEKVGKGWTLWSATLPAGGDENKHVTFVAACSDRVVVTRMEIGDDDNPPVGGWWKRRRTTSVGSVDDLPTTSEEAPKKKKKSMASSLVMPAPGNTRRRRSIHSDDDNSLESALLPADTKDASEEMIDDDLVTAEVRRQKKDYQPTGMIHHHSMDTSWNDDFEYPPTRRVARLLARSDEERQRCVKLGGPYLCAKLVEAALDASRPTFQESDDMISQLTHVCTDEKPGWRHRRVRFNRTVAMLLEAGKSRAHIARLKEYYDQAHQLARAAATVFAMASDHQPSVLGPWLRDLLSIAHADLRRLHQQDNLLHSYIVLARLRHEDDYARVNVLLSLVATIFLPLSFLTGVWGMNFRSLPLKGATWGFSAFIVGSLVIVLVAIAGFWYRGWLNVVKAVSATKGLPSHSKHQQLYPL